MSARLAILPRDAGITPVRLLWDRRSVLIDVRLATTAAAGKRPVMLALEAEKARREGQLKMASGNGHGGRGRPSMLRLRSAGAARRKSPGRDVKALPSRERRVRDGARSGGTAPERALPWSWSDSSAVRLEREDGRV